MEPYFADCYAAAIATYLRDIVDQEDSSSCPVTSSLNSASPDSLFAAAVDVISLNYQGEGLRYGPAYTHLPAFLPGDQKDPQYGPFHETLPDKLILGSEIGWSLSSRGTFLFPVTNYTSSPINDISGENSTTLEVSAYDLYSSEPGFSPDHVFAMQDKYRFVVGGFVWSGWDYFSEPCPTTTRVAPTRLYQSRWRQDLRMAHINPHRTWLGRVGRATPVHVFSVADEAELFLNRKSQGRVRNGPLEYRFRWDDVIYEPGQLHVITYKDGQEWVADTVQTTGEPAKLRLSADRPSIAADSPENPDMDMDLSFVALEVLDAKGRVVPEADNIIRFSVSGPGAIVATDGFQADFAAFPSPERRAFHGLALCIVRAEAGWGRVSGVG